MATKILLTELSPALILPLNNLAKRERRIAAFRFTAQRFAQKGYAYSAHALRKIIQP
jgi:hypothetical protein